MQRIEESELILNSRGAIYHIDLRPEELAGTVLLVGDPGRVPVVSRFFDKIEVERSHREFVAHTGYIGRERFTVLSTGIGTDNIDIVLNELDALVNIDLETRMVKSDHTSLRIIRLGTSGSLQADIPVDHFVASTHGIGIDNLLHFYRLQPEGEDLLQAFITHTQLQAPFARPTLAGAAPGLLKRFTDGYFQGITVTCPGFYGPQGRVLRLGLAQPELIRRLTGFQYGPHRISNFEMETSAIYGLGRLLGHQCLSLNVIVANRISKTFTADSAKAVAGLISKSLDILSAPGH